MFKDYYEILDIDWHASQMEIKSAYRKQSMKWHPYRNPGLDVTAMMQDINEAYAILKDELKRERYNKEYVRFINHGKNHQGKSKSTVYSCPNNTYHTYDYDVKDENLKEDMRQAQEYARNLVAEFMKSFKKASGDAAKGAWDGAKGYIIGGIIASLIFALIRMCH